MEKIMDKDMEKDSKISKIDYLKIKKQALIDRKECENELGNPEKVDVILDAYSESYEGEAKLIYRANFLMPDDIEFKEYYLNHGKSTNSCLEQYVGTEFRDVVMKVTCIEKYGIYNGIDEIQSVLEKETSEMVQMPESLDMEDATKSNNERSVGALAPQSGVIFPTLLTIDETNVEKQTEEAISKINLLFKNNGDKEETIRKQEQTIHKLEEDNTKLKEENADLTDKIESLSTKVVGLEEENSALKKQYDMLISVINEKFGALEEKNARTR